MRLSIPFLMHFCPVAICLKAYRVDIYRLCIEIFDTLSISASCYVCVLLLWRFISSFFSCSVAKRRTHRSYFIYNNKIKFANMRKSLFLLCIVNGTRSGLLLSPKQKKTANIIQRRPSKHAALSFIVQHNSLIKLLFFYSLCIVAWH